MHWVRKPAANEPTKTSYEDRLLRRSVGQSKLAVDRPAVRKVVDNADLLKVLVRDTFVIRCRAAGEPCIGASAIDMVAHRLWLPLARR